MARGSQPAVLMVAEKPSIAKSVAGILSNGHCSTNQSHVCKKCPVHEFTGQFLGSSARIKVTSVLGHVLKVEFDKDYRNWTQVDPGVLFLDASIHKEEANPHDRMREFLHHEATGCSYLVLWLDCDKEGENICFEVIGAVKDALLKPRSGTNIYRAKFSALSEQDVLKAMRNLVAPNYNESRSVDARQELDLRIGCAFTRYQSQFFQSKYVGLNDSMISYGPCQTPTLWFCVEREDAIKAFKPEKYWTVGMKVTRAGSTLSPSWTRHRVFDKEVATLFCGIVKEETWAKVHSVTEKKMAKAPPAGLKTVELLRAASAGLRIGPHTAMVVAERLYTKGIISYPRTETTAYPESFDFKSVVRLFLESTVWGGLANEVYRSLAAGFKPERCGEDVGDHPPITPMRLPAPDELSGADAQIFDYVIRHFFGTLMPPCTYKQTDVIFSAGEEGFQWSGVTVISLGFTSAMTWKAIDAVECSAPFRKGDSWEMKEVCVKEQETTPPGHLTESDLIALMEKHAIGTDASIPVHIENISQRNYVTVTPDRRLQPTTLGTLLIHGYKKIDPELVQPTMRSEVEKQLNLIAQGKADYDDVCYYSLDIFRRKFEYFRDNIKEMETLFGAHFQSFTEEARRMTRCGNCRKYMKVIEGVPLRVLCESCNKFFSLPPRGNIKPYEDHSCPLDGFGLIHWSAGGRTEKSFVLCPQCYNEPPKGAPRLMGCDNCPQAQCPHSKLHFSVGTCKDCMTGSLILDPTSGRKWKLCCNNSKCDTVLGLCDGATRLQVADKLCDKCDLHLVSAEYPKNKSPFGADSAHTGCISCDEALHKRVVEFHGRPQSSRMHSGRGRGRGRGRGQQRGRGRPF